MAEEENNEAEGTEEEGSTEAAPAEGGNSKKLLFIGGGVLLLILLVGAPLIVFLMMSGSGEETEKESPGAAKEKEELVLLMEGFDEEDESEENQKPLGAFYPFETFVVNLSGGGYLRVQAHVEFVKRDIPKKFYSKLVVIRDSLINVLSNKSRKDLGDEEGRADLKAEMRDMINEKLRKQEIEKVYFTQFVIQ